MIMGHENSSLTLKVLNVYILFSFEFVAKRQGEGRRISEEGTRNNDRGRKTENTNCSRSSMDN